MLSVEYPLSEMFGPGVFSDFSFGIWKICIHYWHVLGMSLECKHEIHGCFTYTFHREPKVLLYNKFSV